MKKGVGHNNRDLGGKGGKTPTGEGSFVALVDGLATAARKSQKSRLVACNEHGERVGEDHQHAVLTNAQVEEIRDRYEAAAELRRGVPNGHHVKGELGYRALAREYGVSKRTIREIVKYNRRNVWAARWKRVDK
jgi:hypothetical protein